MILRELNELYKRLKETGDKKELIPSIGESVQKFSFKVVIRQNGDFVRVEDIRESHNKKLIPRNCLVLGEAKPSGQGINPCFLWDNSAYMLGFSLDEKKQTVGDLERTKKSFEEFRKKHLEFREKINSPNFDAVCKFLENWSENSLLEERTKEYVDKYENNGYFEILESNFPVHDDEQIKGWWGKEGQYLWQGDVNNVESMCLVSGEVGRIATLHNPPIKGVLNAQSAGAKLVSFNCESFNSYGKKQSVNSPVLEEVAFGYCNALNYLLRREESRTRIGDATVVYWTDAPKQDADEMEFFLGASLDPSKLDAQDSVLGQRVREYLTRISKGMSIGDQLKMSDVRYHILGLSPNAARLSVRFYKQGPLAEFVENIRRHFSDLSLQKRGEKIKDPDFISPYKILRETVRAADDISPLWAGALMNSILFNQRYPDSIASAIFMRFCVENNEHKINYVRCAFIKAWLTRKSSKYQLKPMLDEENTQVGYVLGRLFSLLYDTQTDHGKNKLNRTILDAYYGSASTTPAVVFPRLLNLYRHHINKLSSEGLKVIREKQVQNVMEKLEKFPSRLSMEQQGLFALGFYHQTQELFVKKSDDVNL